MATPPDKPSVPTRIGRRGRPSMVSGADNLQVDSVSAVHALTEFEKRFVLMVAAGREPVEAFRVSVSEHKQEAKRFNEELGPTPQEALDGTNRLLEQPYIKRYLDELRRPVSSQARATFVDQMLTGSASAQRDAAEQIVKNEDKLGLVDAFHRWCDLLIAHGADIEIALPEVPPCSECGAHQPPLFGIAKFADMFSGHREI